MNRTEFIEELKNMAEKLEEGHFYFINLEEGYIFGNRNYGEVNIPLQKGVYVKVDLYHATNEEREQWENTDTE